MRSTVDGGQNIISARLIIRVLSQPWNQKGRSVSAPNLRYTDLSSDGDSKSYNQVKDVYSADGIQVVKKECVGHVQKRVGTALGKLKKETRLGCKGKLMML